MRKIPPYFLLDAARGVAALRVLIVHLCVAFVGTEGNLHYASLPLYAVSLWGQFGVVMFFGISGYCITGSAYSILASDKTLILAVERHFISSGQKRRVEVELQGAEINSAIVATLS